jgi:hypothetical protein
MRIRPQVGLGSSRAPPGPVSTGFASHRRFQLFGYPERHLFAGAIAPSHRWLDCAPCAPGNPLPLDDAQAAHTHPFFRMLVTLATNSVNRLWLSFFGETVHRRELLEDATDGPAPSIRLLPRCAGTRSRCRGCDEVFTEQVSSIAKGDRLALPLRQANEIKFVMVACR